MARLSILIVFWSACAFAQAPSESDAPKPDPTLSDAGNTSEGGAAVVADEAKSGDDAYRLKLKELQGRVNELKGKVFQTKTRLAILKESVLSDTIAGAEARLLHRNDMGAGFDLEKVIYSLDGNPIFSKIDRGGDLDQEKELQFFDGPVVAGPHTLSVVMIYRGNGFGIFSYLRGYVFTLTASHTFQAEEGKRVIVKAVGYEKGGISTDLKDRPGIRFENMLLDPDRRTMPQAKEE